MDVGPTTSASEGLDFPYQNYNKGDPVGKLADFTNTVYHQYDSFRGKQYNASYTTGDLYAYVHGDEDKSSQFVENTKIQRSNFSRQRNRFTQQYKLRQEREKRRMIGLGIPQRGQNMARLNIRDRQRLMQQQLQYINRRGNVPMGGGQAQGGAERGSVALRARGPRAPRPARSAASSARLGTPTSTRCPGGRGRRC